MGGLSIKSVFQPTVLLALALMAVIVMMILPVPAWLLDVGLAASFALAILIFTITLFIDRPLDFSAFPTILLASLMLRLALNVSSTKLIIGQGHTGTDAAGQVIEGFADFIIGGNVLLGLVVFLVLLIVNFLVITKGAARMAEVGARFALDAMPGKQLAIDSDKGDAVAGLLITLLNFLVGLVIGITLHDMPIGKAFETYTILTIGDGLVTQIPAVIISIAAALLLARGGNKGAADLAISEQIGRHPTALATVAVLMGLFALVPGLPFVPFLLGGVGLAALAYASHRSRGANPASSQEDSLPVSAPIRSMGDILELDDIHVEFAPDLVNMVLDPGVGLEARITNMRQYVATTYGVILSDIRLTDDPGMPPGSYVIRIQGVERARAFLRDNHLLALDPDQYPALAPGETVKEPVYGAPARWIPASEQDRAALSGATLVAPPEVLATHLLEVIRRNLSRLLTMKAMRRLLDEMVNLSDRGRSEANRKLLEDMIPDRVAPDLLHAVLRLLLAEQVSIRNLPLILESIAENRQFGPQPEAICEHVRQRLGFQLVAGLQRPDGSLPLIQLAPEWEDTFTAFEMSGERGRSDVALPPEQFSTLTAGVAEQVQLAGERGLSPALVTSSLRRRFLRTLLIARNVNVPVLSFEEIGFEAKPSLVGVVRA